MVDAGAFDADISRRKGSQTKQAQKFLQILADEAPFRLLGDFIGTDGGLPTGFFRVSKNLGDAGHRFLA